MVDTNLILSIGFTIISNFAATVPVPMADVPRSAANVQKVMIGSPSRPDDLFLWEANGARFTVSDGTVEYFESPGSYFHRRGFRDIPRVSSKDALTRDLTEDLALKLASNALQKLIRTTNTLAGLVPRTSHVGPSSKGFAPFFQFEWPPLTRSPHGATVEVNGRTGKIVFVQLLDTVFRNSQKEDISDGAFAPEKTEVIASHVATSVKGYYAQPTTNDVRKAIQSWLSLCAKLGVPPGTETNLADVNWDRTWLYTNEEISATLPVCQIRFQNGACFESITRNCS